MICFQGPLICDALVTPEALLVTQTLYFSQFFPHFFVGLRRIQLCKMYYIDVCSLLVGIDCVAMKPE